MSPSRSDLLGVCSKEGVSLLCLLRLKAVGLEARLIHGNRVAGMGKLRLVQLACSGAISVPLATRF